jgi:hypothetical protein
MERRHSKEELSQRYSRPLYKHIVILDLDGAAASLRCSALRSNAGLTGRPSPPGFSMGMLGHTYRAALQTMIHIDQASAARRRVHARGRSRRSAASPPCAALLSGVPE